MQSTGHMTAPAVPVLRRVPVGLAFGATGLVFCLSRLLLRGAGVTFNTEALDWYWQLLDPAMLRADLAGSLAALHVQPPLFNLVVGLAAGVARDPGPLLGLLWAGLGLAMMWAVQATLRGLGWATWPAALAAVGFALSLPWIAYESWLFYDFPCAVLLVLGGWCLLRDASRADPRWCCAFAAVLVSLAWSRSLFHLLWVLAGAAIFVTGAAPRARRRAALWMLVPVLLVTGLYARNAATFGFFGSSSWLGLSLTKMTVQRMEPGERARWITNGRLSPYAAVAPFSPLEEHEHAAGRIFDDDAAPALGRRLRSSGHPNFNHRAFIEISDARLADSLAVLRGRPELYAGAVETSVLRFFSSTVHYPPFKETLIAVEPAYRVHAATFGAPAVAVLVYALALSLALANLLRRGSLPVPGARALAGWVVLNLLWVLVVGCLLEVGENHRFRFIVTPLVWIVVLGSLSLVPEALRRRRVSSP